MGILFALLAALGQAFAFVSIKKSYQKLNPSVAFFFDSIFGVLLWVPFALIVGINFQELHLVAPFAILSALLSEAFVFYALSKGQLSISGTIFSTYPIFTIFFSFVINNERLLPLNWLFISLTILGILIVSMPKKLRFEELAKNFYIFWPLAAALAVGLSDTLSKGIIDKTSASTFLFALAFTQIPVALGYLFVTKQHLSQFGNMLKEISAYKFALTGSFLNIVATLFLWLAFASTLASIASPLTATYPAILLILAIVLLKDRPNFRELLGLAVTITGIIGISFYFS